MDHPQIRLPHQQPPDTGTANLTSFPKDFFFDETPVTLPITCNSPVPLKLKPKCADTMQESLLCPLSNHCFCILLASANKPGEQDPGGAWGASDQPVPGGVEQPGWQPQQPPGLPGTAGQWSAELCSAQLPSVSAGYGPEPATAHRQLGSQPLQDCHRSSGKGSCLLGGGPSLHTFFVSMSSNNNRNKGLPVVARYLVGVPSP